MIVKLTRKEYMDYNSENPSILQSIPYLSTKDERLIYDFYLEYIMNLE